jgi:hypothetical protein
VIAADLDEDGDMDLAVTNKSSFTISILRNNGDGTFAEKVDYTTEFGPGSLDAADLDGDGDIDLVTANQVNESVSVFTNNGDGTFAAQADYTTGLSPTSVAVGDLDGDGDIDVVVTNRNSQTVSVFKNNGDGSFAVKIDDTTGVSPYSVIAADLDGDGTLDLATANNASNTVSIFLNATPLPVELTSFTAMNKGPSVELAWKTATEVNNYGFEIHRSKGQNEAEAWEDVGFVEGTGTSTSPREYSFRDDGLTAGTYLYRLKQIDRDGQFEYSPEVKVTVNGTAQAFVLEQNYPNPFNPETAIRYQLSAFGHISLKVYDMLGREVATLVDEVKEAGTHSVRFDGSKLPSGIYICSLHHGNVSSTTRLVLMK